MSEHIELQPEDETGARDVVEAVSVGLVSLVPGAGAFLAPLVERVFSQQADARQRLWMGEFVAVVNKLIDRVDGIEAESLADDPNFYDAAIKAARIATSTASAEKHRALQNALFNIGSGDDTLDEDFQSIFFRYVDELTSSHLRLLAFFRDPPSALGPEKASAIKSSFAGSLINAVVAAFPEWQGQSPLINALAEDLTSRSLLSLIPFQTGMTGNGQLEPRTTALGNQFLDFIRGPFDALHDDSTEENI